MTKGGAQVKTNLILLESKLTFQFVIFIKVLSKNPMNFRRNSIETGENRLVNDILAVHMRLR